MSNWSEIVEFEDFPGWAQQKRSGGPVSLTEDINGHVLSAEEVADYVKEAKETIERSEKELQFWTKAQKPVKLSWWFSASGIFEALVRS